MPPTSSEPAAAIDWIAPDPPVRIERPLLSQAWRHCAFLHWPYDPEAIRPHVPSAFELDLHDGRAWVGLVSFRIAHMNPGRRLPPIPGLRTAHESHLRTYVRGPDGRRGIWMFSLDMAPLQAAALGRAMWFPYRWATNEVRAGADRARYRTRRRSSGGGGLRLDLDLGAAIPADELTRFDHFLTARWVLYTGLGPISAGLLVEHPRWVFRRVTARRIEQTLTDRAGFPRPEVAPLVHYSDGVDALLSWPRLSGRGGRSATT
ncbi:MAG TPA: DUF2071 domain-containing protein [Actinomycetota bacterium]|nr:DUF2071 domain-containing protein [Actinomycetota bacterium]